MRSTRPAAGRCSSSSPARLRIGVSARLAKTAAASLGDKDAERDRDPLAGPCARPTSSCSPGWKAAPTSRSARDPAPFRPAMLAHAIEETDFAALDPADFIAEWKWDGIRVQAVAGVGEDGKLTARLYSRTGEDISKSFPDLVEALRLPGAIDGELLIVRDGRVQIVQRAAAAAQPQSRHAEAARSNFPRICAPTIFWSTAPRTCASCRSPSAARGSKTFVARLNDPRIDISPLVPFDTWDALTAARADPACRRRRRCRGGRRRHAQAARQRLRAGPAEGPVVEVEARSDDRRRGADVRAARPRQALVVLFRLHLRRLDQGRERRRAGAGRQGLFRLHRRGAACRSTASCAATPSSASARCARSTHEPDKGLVFEVAFEGLQRSTRHKSGLAMRFPRISRLRWDKPPREADRLETLEQMLQGIERGRDRAARHCGDSLDRHAC